MNKLICLLAGVAILSLSAIAHADGNFRRWSIGLNRVAKQELIDAGVNKYVGKFEPAASFEVAGGFTQHLFAQHLDGGPLCIAGTPYSVFTKVKDPRKLLILHQGGGACWQNFYFCNILAEDQGPPPPPTGLWTEESSAETGSVPNPLADYSIVYLPYCDGSVFSGDNDVVDPNFPFGPVRFHRGLANATAGMDIARKMFPRARKILVAGSSAGGVGASAFAPFLARMAFGNYRQLTVFNDAGPVATNLNEAGAIAARAADWRFGQFYPRSCTECDDMGQGTGIIKWRLRNDRTIRESFYSTDGDGTNRFFLNVPTQEAYRELIVSEHGKLNRSHPFRYKRFIRSGDGSHTALQNDLFYVGTANGVPLHRWTEDFQKSPIETLLDRIFRRKRSSWRDIVEDFEALPAP